MDADDYWHPQKLELQIQVFKETEGLGLCYTSWYVNADQKQLIRRSFPNADSKTHGAIAKSFLEIFLDPYFGTPGVMLRKKYFEAIGGFDETFQRAEDVDSLA